MHAGLINYFDEDRVEEVVLRSADELIEEYAALNALGAQISIQKWHHSRTVISEIAPEPPLKNRPGPALFAFTSTVKVEDPYFGTQTTWALRINMPRDQARAINGKIGFAIVADLFGSTRVEYQTLIEPTFDNPNDRTVDTTVIAANIRCGIAFGPDQSILAIAMTRPPY